MVCERGGEEMLTRETAAFLPHSKNVQSSNYDGAGPFCAEFPCSLCACIGLLWSTTPSNMPNSDQGTGSDLEWSLGVTFAHCSLRMDSMFRYVVHCMICDLNKDASSKTNLLHYAVSAAGTASRQSRGVNVRISMLL